MRRSRTLVRGLSWFGSVTLVGGVVLLGSGIATAAQPAQKASTATANKTKKTTTTTTSTTTTTLPTSTTTTAPCSPSPATVTSGAASVTVDPGSCIVDGTTVTVTGSGFTPSQPGAMLECNTDNNQPTVQFLGNAIPISCTNPLSKLVSTGSGSFSTTYTIHTGTTGPPCLSSGCTGTAATDSSGGNTIADAAKYACGPPPTFTNGNCGIIYGDSSATDPGITVPFTWNTNTTAPPPSNPPPTPGTQTSPTSATAAPVSKAAASTKASTGALAFTGSGPGLWWLALVGMVLMVLGLFALALVDQPRRVFRLALRRVGRSEPRSP